MRRFFAVVLAYAASKVVFAMLGFSYSPIGDSFSAGNLVIDFGVFVALYAGFDWLLGQLKTFRPRDDA